MARRRFGSIVNVHRNGRAWVEARYTPSPELRDKWPRLPKRFAKRLPSGWEIQAEQWLNDEERLIRLGSWTPPSQRRHRAQAETLAFHDYAARWIARRRRTVGTPISVTTKQKYRENLANHLDFTYGDSHLPD